MQHDDEQLGMYFDAMRRSPPDPSPDFLARVMADAERAQPDAPGLAQATGPAVPGIGRRVVDMLGGWPALAGLAACLVLGVGIGVNPPQGVADVASYYLGTQTDAVMGLFWSYGDLVTEAGA